MGVRGGSALCGALMADCRFLAAHNVMDYSLLVAVSPSPPQPHCTCCGAPSSDRVCPQCTLAVCTACSGAVCHVCRAGSCPIRGHAQQLAEVPWSGSAFRAHDGGFLARDDAGQPLECYYMGIIDWLQPFNMRKTAEHRLKKLVHGPDSEISVVDPARYATRFFAFTNGLIEPPVAATLVLP